VYLDRYMAYSAYESNDYPNGLTSSESFFAKASPDKIIAQDYEYRGKLNAKTGHDSLAILDYKKAMEMDTSKAELNNEMANSYMKMKKYKEAIDLFVAKINSGKASVNDYFSIGRAYYFSKDFVNADSSFSKIVAAQPDLAIGYLWRAKSSTHLDPGNKLWQAKGFYETYIAKIKPEDVEKNKKDLAEAYSYLAAYYASKKDTANAKAYFQKVLEVDPTNAQAKKVLADINAGK
jgi:lipoprotein NlpI